ncbi:PucR family transcriptional regulator [[Mycobacterium] burgundiense]|uniref:Helix-turn-helix domain-containing protein n=1 Tax=[Mycobacterium] burgundiense TaxID=3064286 RepID=A0ABN9NIC4_9MYCO|nr:helix-turn-helix domain-containing protein [Mycolicibacterium sp. MU0053]CAJ1504984.1 helix-turn-helix domain-containing protein [Mycolicibacterium sp. MU0053]
MSTPTVTPEVGRDDTESQPWRWLSAWIAGEHDAILDRLTEEVLGELPELAFAPQRPEVHVREAIGAHVGTLQQVLGQPGEMSPVIMPAVFDDYTRRLARDETPALSVLLRSFDKVHANLWGQLLAAMRSPQRRIASRERADLLEFASARLFQYFHSVSSQTARAYQAARSLHQMRNAGARHELVTRILAGELEQGEAEILLRHEFNTPQIGYVATFDDPSLADRLATTLSHLGGRIGARNHLAMRGPDGCYGWFSGWLSPPREDWSETLRDLPTPDSVVLCLGAPHEGLSGFRQTRSEAHEGHRVAAALSRRGVVLFEEVAHLALATRDLAAARILVERELGRLFATDEATSRLLDTLRVYLDTLASPTRTARRMYIHPNTVIKRLERIEEFLGRPISPNSLNLRMAVELAPLVRAQ